MNIPRKVSIKWWPIYSAALGTCALLTLAAWMFAIGPSIQQLHQRAKRLQELGERRHQSAKLTAALGKIHRTQNAAAAAIADLNLRLDPPAATNTRMATLTRLANECGLTVDEVRPGQSLDYPHYQTIALSLSGTGGYPAITRLLHRMHQEARDIGLQSMDLTADNGNVASAEVRFHLDFLWYATPTQPAPSGIAASGAAIE